MDHTRLQKWQIYISCTFCMQFVDCILQFLIALFNNIKVVSKSEVVHSITMNTYSIVFSILDFIYYSLQEQSKWMIVVTMDLLVYY